MTTPTLPPITFPTLGWGVIDFIEAYLCHGPGDVQGQDATVTDELALFIGWAYRVYPQGHDREGKRLVHRAILSRAKGWAKSEAAGWIDIVEALGPVRCDGFDAEGEPVGRPVKYPFVRCLATEEDQSDNTYGNVAYILTHGRVGDEFSVDVGRSWDTSTRTFIREPGGDGEIVPCTGAAASKDGGKETHATADETHLYVSRELRGMYRTVARNTGKRKDADPWMLDTTTMFQVGERSVFEAAWEKYRRLPIEECVVKHGILLDHREGVVPPRFNDDRSLAKAMRPAYGDAAAWTDFAKKVKITRDAEDPEEEAYRYCLNLRRASSASWLLPEEIAAAMSDFVPAAKSMVTLGFDGSENDDHTVLTGCTEAGDLFTIGAWAPDGSDYLWREEVTEAVAWAFGHFDVKGLYGDPPYWTSEMGAWAAKHGATLSDPNARRVAEFWTNIDSKMAVASGALRTAIRQVAVRINPTPIRTAPLRVVNDRVTPTAGKEDGMSLVEWHFQNARVRKVRIKLEDKAEEAYIVRKERPGSPLKIDSCPSFILARRCRDDALKLGKFEKAPVYSRAAWQ